MSVNSEPTSHFSSRYEHSLVSKICFYRAGDNERDPTHAAWDANRPGVNKAFSCSPKIKKIYQEPGSKCVTALLAGGSGPIGGEYFPLTAAAGPITGRG